jgi:dihydropteroate synthase
MLPGNGANLNRKQNPDLNPSLTRHTFSDWCRNPNRETLVMGIVNVTPDSFSDGGQFFSVEAAIEHGQSLIDDGADIIDIGGESTRPGADPLSIGDELERVIPVIKSIRKDHNDILISIDTYKSEVAQQAIEAGADIVNDVSGFVMDPKMPTAIANFNAFVILMHMKGTPTNMQENPSYDDLIVDISSFFLYQINIAKTTGIPTDKIILDPGIGFGKTADHNFTIIQKLNEFCELDFPIMIGPSRKSFIGTTLDLPPSERIEGTAAAVSAGILNGARIVRVHDVKEMKRVVAITEKIRTAA